jgi:hypothetical protein
VKNTKLPVMARIGDSPGSIRRENGVPRISISGKIKQTAANPSPADRSGLISVLYAVPRRTPSSRNVLCTFERGGKIHRSLHFHNADPAEIKAVNFQPLKTYDCF